MYSTRKDSTFINEYCYQIKHKMATWQCLTYKIIQKPRFLALLFLWKAIKFVREMLKQYVSIISWHVISWHSCSAIKLFSLVFMFFLSVELYAFHHKTIIHIFSWRILWFLEILGTSDKCLGCMKQNQVSIKKVSDLRNLMICKTKSHSNSLHHICNIRTDFFFSNFF